MIKNYIYPPTGEFKIRVDNVGNGNYGALCRRPNGTTYTNKGVDFECTPGSHVYAPIPGKIIRVVVPYAFDKRFKGIVISNSVMRLKLFYMEPIVDIGTKVERGSVIGVCQDISLKYGADCKPHIHMEMEDVSPMLFM